MTAPGQGKQDTKCVMGKRKWEVSLPLPLNQEIDILRKHEPPLPIQMVSDGERERERERESGEIFLIDYYLSLVGGKASWRNLSTLSVRKVRGYMIIFCSKLSLFRVDRDDVSHDHENSNLFTKARHHHRTA